MTIRLIHPFRFHEDSKLSDILHDVNTLAKFDSQLKKYCDWNTDFLSEDEKGNKIRSFLGDGFEVFGEMLLKTHPYDRRIGISNYQPCHPNFGNEDHGVDGRGIGMNNHPATVQLKWRGNPQDVLTANGAHLVNFKNSSHEEYDVAFDDNDNMLIITNCKGLHYYTEEKMLNKKVRCLDRSMIQSRVDHNLPFWDAFRKAVDFSFID